jgi:hypothetical protein
MDETGDAVSNDPCLARTSPGKDEERPFAVKDRLLLGWIEMSEMIHTGWPTRVDMHQMMDVTY